MQSANVTKSGKVAFRLKTVVNATGSPKSRKRRGTLLPKIKVLEMIMVLLLTNLQDVLYAVEVKVKEKLLQINRRRVSRHLLWYSLYNLSLARKRLDV